jgi:hypothetical protein
VLNNFDYCELDTNGNNKDFGKQSILFSNYWVDKRMFDKTDIIKLNKSKQLRY